MTTATIVILLVLLAIVYWHAKNQEDALADARARIDALTEALRLTAASLPQPPPMPAKQGMTPFDAAVRDVARYVHDHPDDPADQRRYSRDRLDKLMQEHYEPKKP